MNSLISLFTLCIFLIIEAQLVKAEEAYQFEKLWPQLNQPWYFHSPKGIAVGNNELIYIADSGNSLIKTFSSTGEFIRSWGGYGSSKGQFINPSGIESNSSGQLYVTDTSNSRIQVFTPEGEYLFSWQTNISPKVGLINPYKISIDSNDLVYIAGKEENNVLVFSADGQFLRKNRSFPKTINSQGEVYESVDNQIQASTKQGQIIRQWGSLGSEKTQFLQEIDISIASNGLIYVADTLNHRIQVFTTEGQWVNSWGSSGNSENKFNRPTSIIIGSDNLLYITDSYNHRIQVFTQEGVFVRQWGSRGSGTNQFKYPSALAISQNQFIYIADTFNDRIQVFTKKGQFVRSWGHTGTSEGEFIYPSGISISANGYIYITDNGNHRIQVFTEEGEFIGSWGTEGSKQGQFNQPRGISISPDQLVYVADSNNSRVQVFTESGQFVRSWGSRGFGDNQFHEPRGIHTSPSGLVYVSDTYNAQIKIFTSEGQLVEIVSGVGSGAGQLNAPEGSATNDRGDLFVADSSNHRIQKFNKQDATSSFIHKAIIVAGGGPSTPQSQNVIWTEAELLTHKAYQALRFQGFQKNEIKYLTAGSISSDLDGNALLDDLTPLNLNSLQQSITEWASDAINVVVYLFDHGGASQFQLNDHEILTREQLQTWVNTLDEKIPGTISIIIESCKPGRFIPYLSGQQRYIITSANEKQPSIISNRGLNSFSYYFWESINSGSNLKEAFKTGRQAMGHQFIEGTAQNAQLESNGDNQFNHADYVTLSDFCLGECIKQTFNAPSILSSTENKLLSGENSTFLTMTTNNLKESLNAWVTIIPPDFRHKNSNEPVSELKKTPLNCNDLSICSASVGELDIFGHYQVTFHAQNKNYQQALPVSTTIFQTKGHHTGPFRAQSSSYDDNTHTLKLDDVILGDKHYQAELIHPVGNFIFSTKVIKKLDHQILQRPDQFDIAKSTLILNKVAAFGRYYKVTLKYRGHLIFKLNTIEELTE